MSGWAGGGVVSGTPRRSACGCPARRKSEGVRHHYIGNTSQRSAICTGLLSANPSLTRSHCPPCVKSSVPASASATLAASTEAPCILFTVSREVDERNFVSFEKTF